MCYIYHVITVNAGIKSHWRHNLGNKYMKYWSHRFSIDSSLHWLLVYSLLKNYLWIFSVQPSKNKKWKQLFIDLNFKSYLNQILDHDYYYHVVGDMWSLIFYVRKSDDNPLNKTLNIYILVNISLWYMAIH